MDQRFFTIGELKLLYRTMDWAEALTSDFFRIAPREWTGCPYEVKTGRQLRNVEVTEKGFAQVTIYEGFLTGRAGEDRRACYRICFQDQLILDATHRRRDGICLPALLLYVGVHELVHIVRFQFLAAPYAAPEEDREAEEQRVTEVSHKILKGVSLHGLCTVREAYEAPGG